MTELPEAVGHLTGLRKLQLKQNALRDLPPSLSNLCNLVALLGGDNIATALPPVVCELPALEQLLWPLNPLRELPPAIGLLTNLLWL